MNGDDLGTHTYSFICGYDKIDLTVEAEYGGAGKKWFNNILVVLEPGTILLLSFGGILLTKRRGRFEVSNSKQKQASLTDLPAFFII